MEKIFKSSKYSKDIMLWVNLSAITIASSAIYVFMEWLFIVTKPSFLDDSEFWEKSVVLFQSIGVLSFVAVTFLLLCAILWLNLHKLKLIPRHKYGSIIPAFILASLSILLIDNFTYTIFNFGISSTSGFIRGFYLILALILIFAYYRFVTKLILRISGNYVLKTILISLVYIYALLFFLQLDHDNYLLNLGINENKNLPNIILIGSDGLNADHMSVYGYERDTTPNIKLFSDGSLMVNNAFSNSANTTGSIISLFTSKYPTQTRVMYPPNVLKNSDAYQHLPGILKQAGYYNVEYTAPHYADSFTLGMLNGFDEVNGKPANSDMFTKLMGAGFEYKEAFFISVLYDRITDRLLHIFFIADMENPYELVTKPSNDISDRDKIADAIKLFGETKDQPIFLHLHLMGTHGNKFKPAIKRFSIGVEQNEPYNTDYYDDSIYNFDHLFGELVAALEDNGQISNTIIILYSDHGMQFNARARIPLIIKFPGNEYSGTINMGQNLDIAPTILDYLGMEIPEWMMGNSLLQQDLIHKPIISTGTLYAHNVSGTGRVLTESFNQPPFYQFDFINVVSCQKWYHINLETYEWSAGDIANYVDPCSQDILYSKEDAERLIINRLTKDGFEIPNELFEP